MVQVVHPEKRYEALVVMTGLAEAILKKLGFDVTGNGPWTAAVPSWRPDIIGEADLVEEVTRVHGFDNIPTTSLPRLSATSKPVRRRMVWIFSTTTRMLKGFVM